MSSVFRRVVILLAGCSLFLTSNPAQAAEGSSPDFGEDGAPDRISQLEDRLIQQDKLIADQQRQLDAQVQDLSALRDQEHSQWLNERRAEQVKALVREVLADAEQRASLLENQTTGGWDNGFFLASADRHDLLRINGLMQARYIANFQRHTAHASGDDQRNGFEMARSRVWFSGNVIDPTWKYLLLINFNRSGAAAVLDAFISKDLGHGFHLTVGQFKTPLMHELLVSSKSLQLISRSLVSTTLSGSYTQGVMLSHVDENLHLYGSFNDGLSNLSMGWDSEDTEYALTGRAEWKLAGDWRQYADWQAWPDEELLLVFAAAAHYQQGELGSATDESQILRWTAEAALQYHGAGLFASIVGDHSENGVIRDMLGVVVQGGFFLTPQCELTARYEWAQSDAPSEEELSLATIGLNWFFAKHRAKWSIDVGYAINPISASWASNSLGYRLDAPGSEGQTVVRTQMQLWF